VRATRQTILDVLRENWGAIRQFGVLRLGLFGSCVRNAAKRGSDIDLLVEFERKSFDSYMDLKFFLEDLFGRNVDIVIADSLKPGLRRAVLKDVAYVRDC
jgi:predicted nucleotidyltransferase